MRHPLAAALLAVSLAGGTASAPAQEPSNGFGTTVNRVGSFDRLDMDAMYEPALHYTALHYAAKMTRKIHVRGVSLRIVTIRR